MLTRAGVTDPVQRDVVIRRLGLRGRPMTLKAIGARHAYSKQRIQQIEAEAARVARSAEPASPLLDKALKLVRERAPMSAVGVPQLLQAHNIHAIDYERLTRIADFFGRPGFDVQVILGNRMVCARGHGEALRAVTECAERLCSRFGLFTLSQLKEKLDEGLSLDQIRELLGSLDNYRFVDGGMIYSRRLLARSSLMLNLRKVFAVRSALPLEDVLDGLNRARRQRHRKAPLPLSALRSLFEQEPGFRLRENMVSCNRRLRAEAVLCSSELGLLRVFEDAHGETLSFEDAVHKASRRKGLSREAAVYYLQHSPIIKKQGRGRYALRG